MSNYTALSPNATDPADQFVGYTQDPSGRGTVSLIINCLLTLVLCVWSALHLNVPAQNQTRLQKVLLNVRWIIGGIYAPELVVFAAWRQWCSARILQKFVEDKVAGSDGIVRAGKRRLRWTMTHSFFACTGGFAFELDGLDGVISGSHESETRKARRLTITARGVALLAKCRLLPIVEEQEIEDKSKANDLAKATVLVQATWMLVQVIGRLAFRLPVTLLEVNTVAHVLCAFGMYLFWWHKPLLPNEPIVLRDDNLTPLAAFMYSGSEISGYVRSEGVKSQTIVKTFFAHLKLYSKAPELETIALRASIPRPIPGDAEGRPGISAENGRASDPTESEFDILKILRNSQVSFQHNSHTCVAHIKSKREKEKATAFFERRPRVLDERPADSKPTEADLKRWSLIRTALQTYPVLLEDSVMLTHLVEGKTCAHLRPEQLLADHIQNWPSSDLLRNVDGLVVGMVLWLANFCYGGIHAAAWNDHFPSVAEKWMWRSSAAYIGFCGGLWVVLNFVVARYPILNSFWEHWMDGEKTWWESFGLGVVVFVCGFSLVLARAFIVVEAFVSIRELSVMAYETPQWTNIFPHL